MGGGDHLPTRGEGGEGGCRMVEDEAACGLYRELGSRFERVAKRMALSVGSQSQLLAQAAPT